MRKCGICNLYVESEAKFCPYCGKRIYTAVSTEFEDEEVKLKKRRHRRDAYLFSAKSHKMNLSLTPLQPISHSISAYLS